MSNRPKRRKFKDNPYTIIEIEISNKYFVTFKDGNGIFNKVEVSKDIYELFNYYELRGLSQMNEYDNYGNILSKKVYTYNTTTLLSENTYSYENSNWQDLLTKFNNESITYDNIGNPLTIGDKTFTWENGRELSTYNDGTNNISYKYNLNGIRTSKIVNNVETKYYLEGTKIIFEDRNNTMLYYLYNGDELLGFVYNGNTYYYHKNVFGDILGILNSNYAEIVTYEYDSWGAISNITDNSGINLGIINPFRYRSYYYDEETKLYYLNSRYYNPEWGRFINGDSLITGQGIISNNIYCYCANNPINRTEYDGNSLIMAIIVGVAVSGLSQVISNKLDGKKDLTENVIEAVIIGGTAGLVGGTVHAILTPLINAGLTATNVAAISAISSTVTSTHLSHKFGLMTTEEALTNYALSIPLNIIMAPVDVFIEQTYEKKVLTEGAASFDKDFITNVIIEDITTPNNKKNNTKKEKNVKSTKSNTKVKEDNKSSVKMPNLFPKPPVMGPLELRKEMAKNSLNKKISSMLLFRR